MKCGVRSLILGLLMVVRLAQSSPNPMTILDYIKQTWPVLTRSHQNLAIAAVDPKLHPLPDGRWPVYLPPDEDTQRVEEQLRREMPPGDYKKIKLRPPPQITNKTGAKAFSFS